MRMLAVTMGMAWALTISATELESCVLTHYIPQDFLETAIRTGYRIALARDPSSEELTEATSFVNQQLTTYPGADARELALADFCQVLMCLNEFIYVD